MASNICQEYLEAKDQLEEMEPDSPVRAQLVQELRGRVCNRRKRKICCSTFAEPVTALSAVLSQNQCDSNGE